MHHIHRHWNLYSKFCSQFSLSKLPLSANNVIPFLQLYSESVSCHSTVANTLSSIKTVSKIKGSIPSNQFLFDVNIFMSGLKRSLVMAVNQMAPVTPQLLLHLSKCVDFKSSFHVCMWAAMLFLFFTFFRKSNVLPMSAHPSLTLIVRSQGVLFLVHRMLCWSKCGGQKPFSISKGNCPSLYVAYLVVFCVQYRLSYGCLQ